MSNFGKRIKEFSANVFGTSESQRRMAKNTVKMILGDMVTLYQEFKTHLGTGALFFMPNSPTKSSYVTVKDLVNDKAIAEEMCDKATGEFLTKLIHIIEKNEESGKPVIVMTSGFELTVHVLDLNEIDENINKVADAAS